MPITVPALLTDAMPGALLPQVPPVVASARVVVALSQRAEVPVMAATVGKGITVSVPVACALPQLLVIE
jgi:hypothetical protein